MLTEGGDEAAPLLALMQDNAARNSGLLAAAGARVEVASLHWGREPLPAGPFDVVIGSDITWGSDDEAHAGLAATLAALLRRDVGVRAVLAMEHGLPLPVEQPPHANPPLSPNPNPNLNPNPNPNPNPIPNPNPDPNPNPNPNPNLFETIRKCIRWI